MNYFASVSFDLLNYPSRPWVAPFKGFLQIIKCNVPVISISHPAQNSLDLKTGVSSSETLVPILNQPVELNSSDVSLPSSEPKQELQRTGYYSLFPSPAEGQGLQRPVKGIAT